MNLESANQGKINDTFCVIAIEKSTVIVYKTMIFILIMAQIYRI